MISDILGCLAGKAQMPPNEGMETMHSYPVSQAWQLGDWSGVRALADAKGMRIWGDGETVYMQKGNNKFRTFSTQGGVDMARKFLEGVR